MKTKLIMIDNDTALISTNNLDCQNTHKYKRAGGQHGVCAGATICRQLLSVKDLPRFLIRER